LHYLISTEKTIAIPFGRSAAMVFCIYICIRSVRDLGRNERTCYELFEIAAAKAHSPMAQFDERNFSLENPGSNSGGLEAQKGCGLWDGEKVSFWNDDCLGHGRKSPCVYC
jgi:hypothetical protein